MAQDKILEKIINKNNFTMLSEEQIRRMELFRRVGTKSAASAYVRDLRATIYPKNHVKHDLSENGRTVMWDLITKPEFNDRKTVVSTTGAITSVNIGNECSIRPIISYEGFDNINFNGTRNMYGILEIDYGEYPQKRVRKQNVKVLEELYLQKKLLKTGKRYTITYIEPSGDENEIIHYYTKEQEKIIVEDYEEYEYGGKKYIRHKENMWYEVTPIKWYVDEKEKLIVCKNVIIQGNFIKDMPKHNWNFEKTTLFKLLNKYFKKEIIPQKAKIESFEKEGSAFQIEVAKILEEIKKYSVTFQKKDLLNQKINRLLEEYNNKLESIGTNQVISLENKEKLKIELITKLSQILNQLKNYYKNNEVFYNAIKNIEQMIELLKLEGKSTLPENEKDIPLVKEIKQIASICLPFLDNKEANNIKKEILTILSNEKNRLTEYLQSFENLEENVLLKSTKPLEYSSLEEFELLLREKLHPVLQHLKSKVDSRCIELEIRKKLNEIIEDIYLGTKNEVISIYIEEINQTKEKINQLIEQVPNKEIYIQRLNKIILREIDYRKEKTEILKEISEIIIALYKIENEIKEQLEEKKSIQDSKINIRM